ncbi:hypothetical protein Dda_0963 [Drechslerella dactyloides]|uniref:Urease accessory protein UreF n=1 Tax=Drechslerella dactyloides TaxID=74499 RepID=A0AAD6J8F1_DREDA|nr:hypothetical protein Dda_0963 [Drechslerella dactyloides]
MQNDPDITARLPDDLKSPPPDADEALRDEIRQLENQLAAAKAKLLKTSPSPDISSPPLPPESLHLWLLLADSALPIGSFAFSSALESFISHRSYTSTNTSTPAPTPRLSLTRFLRLSLLSVSTTTIPFVAAAFRDPLAADSLDDTLDASTTCQVARRASISQGRALCSVWDKSFAASLLPKGHTAANDGNTAVYSYRPDHFAVAWGVITRRTGILPDTPQALHQVLFVFLFNHVKAVLSAAVRLSLIGPYVAQQILAAPETRALVSAAVDRGGSLAVEEAGQSVPALDLWQGRHEKLYTRIFNS